MIRSFLAGLLCAVACSLAAGMPWAADAVTSQPPNLVGTWEGEHAEANADGRLPMHFRLEIHRQEGALLWATDVWTPKDPQTGQLSSESRQDPMLGSLNSSGTSGVLVKEGAQLTFRILDQNRLETEFINVRTIGGFPPTAFYAILVRNGQPPAPTWDKLPQLVDIWRGQYRYALLDGGYESEFELEVTRQDRELLWADDVWRPADAANAAGLEAGGSRRQRMLGSLSPAGNRGIMAKEYGVYSFKIIKKDLIEVEFVQMANTIADCAVFHAVLQRGRLHPLKTTKPLPNLVGKWTAECRYPLAEGARSKPVQLEITRQDGPLLWGENPWQAFDPVTDRPVGPLRHDPFVGSLHASGRSGVLAKPGARFAFTVLDKDHLETQFVRILADGQPPLAFYTIFKRVK